VVEATLSSTLTLSFFKVNPVSSWLLDHPICCIAQLAGPVARCKGIIVARESLDTESKSSPAGSLRYQHRELSVRPSTRKLIALPRDSILDIQEPTDVEA